MTEHYKTADLPKHEPTEEERKDVANYMADLVPKDVLIYDWLAENLADIGDALVCDDLQEIDSDWCAENCKYNAPVAMCWRRRIEHDIYGQ